MANIVLSLLSPKDNKILEAIRNLRRINTKLAIKFSINATKTYYHFYYIFIKLNINNIIYLKLHKRYYLLNKPN